MELAIKHGTVMTPEGPIQADIGIEGERIAAIGQELHATTELDASGRLVIPGAVDVHVHMHAPVGHYFSSDDFFSGTVAAACGGTTTIIDFTEPDASTSLLDGFRNRRAEADPQVAVDYGLHMVLANDHPQRLAEIPALMVEGCTSFKLFLAYEEAMLGDEQLIHVLAALKRYGGFPIVHAENHHAILYLQREFLSQGKTEPRYHPLSRPAYMEREATGRALSLARVVGQPMYIAHVSCAEAAAEVRYARQSGFPAFGEVCPHHLLLSQADCDRPAFEGAKFVMSPPLREEADRRALWDAVATGDLQVISTDHCAFFFATEKSWGRAAFTEIPNGVPGIEARLSLIYTFGVCTDVISLARWVELCCSEPARLFGLAPRKGQIVAGADADLVIFDPEKRVTLTKSMLHEKTDYTPYEGMRLQGYPEVTLLRGKIIAREGEFLGEPGQGRYIRRRRSGPASS
jgi:dihydropyrimidinase